MPEELNADSISRLQEHEEVQQILGRPPGLLLRWGMLALMLGAMLLLALAAWLPFPESIVAPVTLKSQTPVSYVKMPVDGVISQVLVQNGQEVVAEQALALIENTASMSDVDEMEKWLQQASANRLRLNAPPRQLQLGPIQNTYADLLIAWDNAVYWSTIDPTLQKLAQLRQQRQRLLKLQENIEADSVYAQKEVEITQKSYEDYKQLKEKGSASAVETDAAHLAFLRAQSQRERLKAEAKKNQINIGNIDAELAQVAHVAEKGSLQDDQGFLAQVRRMQSAILQWRQSYVIKSPQAGHIVLTNTYFSPGYFDRGKELFAVNPDAASLIATGMLPQNRVGSLQVGARTLLRFEAFPFDEYGEMEGKLQAIAPVADAQGQYRIEIKVSSKGITTTGRNITLKPEQNAKAWIRLKERSLLQRLFDKWKVLSKSRQ